MYVRRRKDENIKKSGLNKKGSGEDTHTKSYEERHG